MRSEMKQTNGPFYPSFLPSMGLRKSSAWVWGGGGLGLGLLIGVPSGSQDGPVGIKLRQG